MNNYPLGINIKTKLNKQIYKKKVNKMFCVSQAL